MGGVCKRDCGQVYNTVINPEGHCMACQGDIRLLGYDPVGRVWMSCAESLSDLPPHEVTDEGVNTPRHEPVRAGRRASLVKPANPSTVLQYGAGLKHDEGLSTT